MPFTAVISNICLVILSMVATNKQPKSKNRKYISYSGKMVRGGITYKINCKKSGVYSTIIHRTIDQLDICMDKWKRVLVIRFDLHQPFYTGNNKGISRFRKNLNRRLEREYSINEIGYIWAREKEIAKTQHYHFAIYLDGNKIRHSSKILKIIRATWEAMNENNHMPVIKNPYYFVDDEQSKQDAVYRISYLAKARGKGYRDMQAKDYSTSRLIQHVST